MKDIKSILIGVFATTCLFLFMGNTNYITEKKNKFEIHKLENGVSSHLLNTETGEVWSITRYKKKKLKDN